VHVAGDVVRHRGPEAALAVADLDDLQVERGEHQFHLPPGQGRLDLVGVAVQRHCRGLGDRALLRPQERLGQRLARGHYRAVAGPLPAVVPPGQRRLPGLGVHVVVIDGLHPRGEPGVEFEQARSVGELLLGQLRGAGIGHLDEELLTHGPEKAFDLPAALGPVRGGVHQPDPEFGAGP